MPEQPPLIRFDAARWPASLGARLRVRIPSPAEVVDRRCERTHALPTASRVVGPSAAIGRAR